MGLLLESTLRLNSQFRGHVCDLLSKSQEDGEFGIALIRFWWLKAPGLFLRSTLRKWSSEKRWAKLIDFLW